MNLGESVLLDFGNLFGHLRDKVKYYLDLSHKGDYLEAINSLYDALRWAETKEDANFVIITNFIEL